MCGVNECDRVRLDEGGVQVVICGEDLIQRILGRCAVVLAKALVGELNGKARRKVAVMGEAAVRRQVRREFLETATTTIVVAEVVGVDEVTCICLREPTDTSVYSVIVVLQRREAAAYLRTYF